METFDEGGEMTSPTCVLASTRHDENINGCVLFLVVLAYFFLFGMGYASLVPSTHQLYALNVVVC